MSLNTLERRRSPRTHAFVPIRLRMQGTDQDTPAHLLDLSATGAGILTTAGHAPQIGQQLNISFDRMNNDGGSERAARCETGIVINLQRPERGIVRLGIRFLENRDINCDLFDPIDTLSDYRKDSPMEDPLRRWETARHFQSIGPAERTNRRVAVPV